MNFPYFYGKNAELRVLKGINSDPNKNRRVNENSTNDKRANMKKFSSVLLTLTAVFALQGCLHDDDDEATVPPPPPPPAPTTIVDVAVADGNFTTLVAALQATGLDATLADTSATFTVFAPTDAAFAVLGEETIAALLEDTDALSSILTFGMWDTLPLLPLLRLYTYLHCLCPKSDNGTNVGLGTPKSGLK